MRWISSFVGMLVGLAIIAVAGKFLGLEDIIRRSIEAGHLLDWVMGGFSLVWLMVILKAPWDLFFQANAVAFEQNVRGSATGADAEPEDFRTQLRDYFAAFPADQFPNFVALADALVEGDDTERFEFGLDVLVSGLAAVAARER